MANNTLNLMPALAEIFILGMVVFAILAELFASHRCKDIAYYTVLSALFGGGVLTLLLPGSAEKTVALNGLFVSNLTTVLLKSFIYLSVFMALCYSKHYVDRRNILRPEYYILALFSTLGMLVLISANSLLLVYLGLELLSLPLYAMVSLDRDDTANTEAALKYFVMGAVASALLLYGMSMLYGATGTLMIPHIAVAVSAISPDHMMIVTVGMVFLLAGIGFKLAMAPFHMWAPDVYSGAPLSVTLFISTAPKLAAFGMAIQLLVTALGGVASQWQDALIFLAVLSMAVGNILALAQVNIRRMLAYSAVAQVGYMALGLIAATPDGYASALFYMLIYALTSLAGFGLLLVLAKDGFEPESLSDLSGLNARSPWLAAILLIVMLSLAGIPPTIGFFAKFWVLKALIDVGSVQLAAVAMLFAVVGLFYYLRVIKVMYFDAPLDTQPLVYAGECKWLLTANGLSLLALGIFPLALLQLCQLAFK